MKNTSIVNLSPDKSPVIGISMASHPNLSGYEEAVISDGFDEQTVPMKFYKGASHIVRSQLHKDVDDFMDMVEDWVEKNSRKTSR